MQDTSWQLYFFFSSRFSGFRSRLTTPLQQLLACQKTITEREFGPLHQAPTQFIFGHLAVLGEQAVETLQTAAEPSEACLLCTARCTSLMVWISMLCTSNKKHSL